VVHFEELTMTVTLFLAVVENTACCHVPVGTLSHLDGAPHHIYFHAYAAFLVREFCDHWMGKGRLIPKLTLPCFFLLGACKRHCLS